MSEFTDTARRVIGIEADALKALSAALDDQFDAVVTAMIEAKGRVIVSGMGKSGHVARKIAATLASTGTPAHFVHPAEASHGDLGMLTRGDVVLVLSNSGETPELADLIAHCKRFGILLIGVASKPKSSLMQQADLRLVLPPVEEACGTGVVPTTTTTMTMALGDALAVALMETRGFSAENFREFHPGGKLGARLSKVSDLMHTEMPLAGLGTPMGEALLIMSQKGFGVVGVTDAHGKLAGIITDGDLRRKMEGLLDKTVDDVMTTTPRTVRPDALAERAVALMTDPTPQITCLFAVDPDGVPKGILHIHDCLRAGVV